MTTNNEDEDMNYTCRACLVIDVSKLFITLLEEPLRTAFLDCTSIEVSADDQVPTQLCSICVARCEAAKFFRDMAIANDTQMKEQRTCTLTPPDEDIEDNPEVLTYEPLDDDNCIVYSEQTEAAATDALEGELIEEESTAEVPEPIFETIHEDVVEEDIFGVPYVEEEEVEEQLEKQPTKQLNSPSFECQFCGAIFPYRATLMTHYTNHHPDEVYTCQTCGKTFNSAHTWRIHNCRHNQGHYCCDVCGKVFQHRNVLNAHVKTHSGPQHTCEHCQKSFVHLSQYKTHLKRHSQEKGFICEHCLKGFKERREMLRHIQIVHTDQRPFKCDLCPRAFAFRYMLTRHGQVHSGVRPYPCSVCGQSLSSPNALKHHMFTHTGAKPYTCELCPAAFRIKVNLTRHLRDHEGQTTALGMSIV